MVAYALSMLHNRGLSAFLVPARYLSSEQHNGNTVYRLIAQCGISGMDENFCALGYHHASSNSGPWDGTLELVRNSGPRELQRWWIIPAEPYNGQASYAEATQQPQGQQETIACQSAHSSRGDSAVSQQDSQQDTHSEPSMGSSSTDMMCIGTGVAGQAGNANSSSGVGPRPRLFHICAVDRRGKHYLSCDANKSGASLALWWRAEANGLQVGPAGPVQGAGW
jgi:hypothetical protein